MTLKTTEETIKEATELKNDEDVLHDIRDVDLLAKEFQVHDKYRLDYTRKRDSIENCEKDIQTFGNFDAVKNFLEDHVLKNNQAASMSLMNDLSADDHNGDARYRSKISLDKLYMQTLNPCSPCSECWYASIPSQLLACRYLAPYCPWLITLRCRPWFLSLVVGHPVLF